MDRAALVRRGEELMTSDDPIKVMQGVDLICEDDQDAIRLLVSLLAYSNKYHKVVERFTKKLEETYGAVSADIRGL